MLPALTRLYRTYMPSIAREAIMMKRRTPIWTARGVIFIHVPKCAGSSVNDALYGRFMGHIPAHIITRFGNSELANVPSFGLLRDPVARAVSAYRFVRAGTGVGSGVTAQVRNPERYQTPAFSSFDSFVQEWLPQQNLRKVDPVFRTQTSYVCSPSGQPLVDHLGRVENQEPTIHWLYDVLGRTVSFARTNVTAPASSGTQIVPSKASRSSLELMYKDDFELLNTLS